MLPRAYLSPDACRFRLVLTEAACLAQGKQICNVDGMAKVCAVCAVEDPPFPLATSPLTSSSPLLFAVL